MSWAPKALAALGLRLAGAVRAEGEHRGWRVAVGLEEHDGDVYTSIAVRLKQNLRCRLWASTMSPDDDDQRVDVVVEELPEFWRVRAFDGDWAERLLAPMGAMLTRESGRGRELVIRDDQLELWFHGELATAELEDALARATALAKRLDSAARAVGPPAWERDARRSWKLYADRRGLTLADDALVLSGPLRMATTYRDAREIVARIEGRLRRDRLETRITVQRQGDAPVVRRHAGIALDGDALESQVRDAIAGATEEADAPSTRAGDAHREPPARTRRRRRRMWIGVSGLAASSVVLGVWWTAPDGNRAPSIGLSPFEHPDPDDCNAFCQKAVRCGGDGRACMKECPSLAPACRACLAATPCEARAECVTSCERPDASDDHENEGGDE